MKRLFDIALSLVLLVILYIPARLARLFGAHFGSGGRGQKILLLPEICLGRMSFVGLPFEDGLPIPSAREKSYLGKPGLTGLLQISDHNDLRADERERFKLYYAKNQTLGLDLEILLKALLSRRQRRR